MSFLFAKFIVPYLQLCEAEKQGKPIFYYFPPEEAPCAP